MSIARFSVSTPPSADTLAKIRADVADAVARATARAHERAEIRRRRQAVIEHEMRRQAEAAQKPTTIDTKV